MIAILADAFVKATILLCIAGVTMLVLRRSAAALRHLVWALACIGVLALPVASSLLPDMRLRAWPRIDVPTVVFDAEQIPMDGVVAPRLQGSPTARQTTTPPPSPADAEQVRWQLHSDWRTLVVPVWVSGVSLVLIALAIGLIRISWLGRTALPVRDPEWLSLLHDLTRGLGLRQRIRLLQSEGPAMPMTWGVANPVILLPASADAWPEERRRDVLLHELAHVKRHDFLVQLVARLACAVYWFHPLVWLAATRLRVERERACDDQVLRAGTMPSAYATHLLEIARSLRAARATSLASVAMARPSQLATRLLDVLDARRSRDTLSARAAAPAWIAAVAVVLPLAAAAPRIGEPTAIQTNDDPPVAYVVPTARRVAAAAPARSVALIDTLRGCSGETRHTSSHTRVDNDDLTIVTTSGGCTIRLSAVGKFEFNEDFTDFASISSGGQVVVEVDYGAHDRRVTIRPSGGALQRTYKVDGDVRPFDAEAQTWLRETITYLLRRTGYQAGERARWILDRRGIQGLLDEFGELSGDYTRRIYYQAAIESGKLDVAGYERLVNLAAETISSDYELAELLIAVSKAQPLTERMQAGFVNAAKSVSSDYERHRVLSAALSRPGLTPAVQSAMLDVAAGINSDYELATLLIELNDARPIDEAVRPAFFKAANSLSSDYEHRRVLTAVAGRDGVSGAMLLDALQSARSIESDYELAELLVEVAGAYGLDETLRAAFFKAAGTIQSDYEHGRALKSALGEKGSEVSPAVAVEVVESSRSMASDYELAEVLIAVIRRAKLTDSLQTAIRSTTATLRSQYERGRVLDALNQRSARTPLE